MTRTEFGWISRVLTNELFISSEDLEAWKMVGKCDIDDVLRYLEQFRVGRQMGLRLVPDPSECKEWCENWHGYDPNVWRAIKEAMECGI